MHTTLFNTLKCSCPLAYSVICGNADNPRLNGKAFFYSTPYGGTLIEIEISGLPDVESEFPSAFYGMHIHETGNCTVPFDQTGEHYNPCDMPHPFHAGDMPVLLSSYGYSFMVFYTARFEISDIIGRSLIIHSQPDDFTTQPSGNSGVKIGCGVICDC